MSFHDVQDRGRQFLDFGGKRGTKPWKALSSATILTTGLITKGFLKCAVTEVDVENLDILTDALKRAERENRGVVTYMNHMSLLDDPFIWGVLPFSHFLSPDKVRWSLGADNVCFNNR